MNIFHISAECFPVAKVGGLADVVGALPKYQTRLGHKVNVVVPSYKTPFVGNLKLKTVFEGKIVLGNNTYIYSVQYDSKDTLGFNLFLIDIPKLFDTADVYLLDNDTERFLAFQIAFLNWINSENIIPDIIHTHDHHTGLIPFMVKHALEFRDKLANVPTLLTIHNGQYHGSFGFDKLHLLPQFDPYKIGLLEWNGQINPLATAIKCVWKITTVSPTYMLEMANNANGLEDLLRVESTKSIGILNGIDSELWNPQTDKLIENNYSPRNFKKVKEINKQILCEKFELDPSKPLFAYIGRFAGEKGADLLPHAVSIAMHKFEHNINILVLGSGDKEVEDKLNELKTFYKGNYNCFIGYNESLAHLIYAGADFLLMPSRVEPCGLNQMYALRYGTIPIVRRTGGLKDTVIDIGDNGVGICHDQASVEDIIYSIGRGYALYLETENMEKVVKKGMKINHSWEKAAETYLNVYKELKELTADVW